MNDRFKFRVWVPVLYYDKNGNDCETVMCIENVGVYSDGVGCSKNDLDTAIINLNLSELDEESVRNYIEDNYSTESDLWYFFDNANIIKEQCTGFSDKNGILIYEGDIIKCGSATGVVKFGFYRKADEHFPDSIYGFYIEWEKQCSFRQDFGYWITEERIEIVGNIHTGVKGE